MTTIKADILIQSSAESYVNNCRSL